MNLRDPPNCGVTNCPQDLFDMIKSSLGTLIIILQKLMRRRKRIAADSRHPKQSCLLKHRGFRQLVQKGLTSRQMSQLLRPEEDLSIVKYIV